MVEQQCLLTPTLASGFSHLGWNDATSPVMVCGPTPATSYPTPNEWGGGRGHPPARCPEASFANNK
jgi:hypothetical protein